MDLVGKTAFIYPRNCEKIQNLKKLHQFHIYICEVEKRLSLSDFSGGTPLSVFRNTNVVRLRGANEYDKLFTACQHTSYTPTSRIHDRHAAM